MDFLHDPNSARIIKGYLYKLKHAPPRIGNAWNKRYFAVEKRHDNAVGDSLVLTYYSDEEKVSDASAAKRWINLRDIDFVGTLATGQRAQLYLNNSGHVPLEKQIVKQIAKYKDLMFEVEAPQGTLFLRTETRQLLHCWVSALQRLAALPNPIAFPEGCGEIPTASQSMLRWRDRGLQRRTSISSTEMVNNGYESVLTHPQETVELDGAGVGVTGVPEYTEQQVAVGYTHSNRICMTQQDDRRRNDGAIDTASNQVIPEDTPVRASSAPSARSAPPPRSAPSARSAISVRSSNQQKNKGRANDKFITIVADGDEDTVEETYFHDPSTETTVRPSSESKVDLISLQEPIKHERFDAKSKLSVIESAIVARTRGQTPPGNNIIRVASHSHEDKNVNYSGTENHLKSSSKHDSQYYPSTANTSKNSTYSKPSVPCPQNRPPRDINPPNGPPRGAPRAGGRALLARATQQNVRTDSTEAPSTHQTSHNDVPITSQGHDTNFVKEEQTDTNFMKQDQAETNFVDEDWDNDSNIDQGQNDMDNQHENQSHDNSLSEIDQSYSQTDNIPSRQRASSWDTAENSSVSSMRENPNQNIRSSTTDQLYKDTETTTLDVSDWDEETSMDETSAHVSFKSSQPCGTKTSMATPPSSTSRHVSKVSSTPGVAPDDVRSRRNKQKDRIGLSLSFWSFVYEFSRMVLALRNNRVNGILWCMLVILRCSIQFLLCLPVLDKTVRYMN